MRLPDARVGRGTRAQSAHVRQYATISAARTPTAGGARGGTVTVGQQLQPGAPGTRLPTQGQPRPHSSKQQTSTVEFYLPDRIRHFWARFRPIQSSRRNWTCPVYPRATANETLPKRPKGAPSFPLSPLQRRRRREKRAGRWPSPVCRSRSERPQGAAQTGEGHRPARFDRWEPPAIASPCVLEPRRHAGHGREDERQVLGLGLGR